MDFLQKYFYRVFELPLPRNAQKRILKKKPQKIFGVGWFHSEVNQIYAGVRRVFFGVPLLLS
jgi:hypothetical protein